MMPTPATYEQAVALAQQEWRTKSRDVKPFTTEGSYCSYRVSTMGFSRPAATRAAVPRFEAVLAAKAWAAGVASQEWEAAPSLSAMWPSKAAFVGARSHQLVNATKGNKKLDPLEAVAGSEWDTNESLHKDWPDRAAYVGCRTKNMLAGGKSGEGRKIAEAAASAEWDSDTSLRVGWTSKENYVSARALEFTGQLRR